MRMRNVLLLVFSFLGLFFARPAAAQTSPSPDLALEATQSAEALRAEGSQEPEATGSVRQKTDLTEPTEEEISELRSVLEAQDPGSVYTNPLKHAIRSSVESGVPVNTIVLLLLLPLVAALIAAARHIIGLRGFGIFLPAALSVVFVATGPIVGLGLFFIIVLLSTAARMFLRKTKVKLQYLPRMALILWLVVLGVLGALFTAPLLKRPALAGVSIFPVLFLVLLAEDFTRAQLGKSVRTAISLTSETLILSLASFGVLTFKPVQIYALLHPEQLLLLVAVFDFLAGKYMGLRFLEFWRFRRLISG